MFQIKSSIISTGFEFKFNVYEFYYTEAIVNCDNIIFTQSTWLGNFTIL